MPAAFNRDGVTTTRRMGVLGISTIFTRPGLDREITMAPVAGLFQPRRRRRFPANYAANNVIALIGGGTSGSPSVRASSTGNASSSAIRIDN